MFKTMIQALFSAFGDKAGLKDQLQIDVEAIFLTVRVGLAAWHVIVQRDWEILDHPWFITSRLILGRKELCKNKSEEMPSNTTTTTTRLHHHPEPTSTTSSVTHKGQNGNGKTRRSKWHRTHPRDGVHRSDATVATTTMNKHMNKQPLCTEIVKVVATPSKTPVHTAAVSFQTLMARLNIESRRNTLRTYLGSKDSSKQDDPNTFLETLGDVLQELRLTNDRKMVEEAMETEPLIFQFASASVRNHPFVAFSAVQKCSENIHSVSQTLKDSNLFVWWVLKLDNISHDLVLSAVSDRLRDDPIIVSTAIQGDPFALKYASERLKLYDDVVLQAVGSPGGGCALLDTLQFPPNNRTPTFQCSRAVLMTALKNWDETRTKTERRGTRRLGELGKRFRLSGEPRSWNATRDDLIEWSGTILCHVKEEMRYDLEVMEAVLRVSTSKTCDFNYNLPMRYQECPRVYALFLKCTSPILARLLVKWSCPRKWLGYRQDLLMLQDRCYKLMCKLKDVRYFADHQKYAYLQNLTPHAVVAIWKHHIAHTKWCVKQIWVRYDVPQSVSQMIVSPQNGQNCSDWFGFAQEIQLLEELEAFADIFFEAEKLSVWPKGCTWWHLISRAHPDWHTAFNRTFLYKRW